MNSRIVWVVAVVASLSACLDVQPIVQPDENVVAFQLEAAERVTICHRTGAGWHALDLPQPAIAAHLRHGDRFPGEEIPGEVGLVFSESCEPLDGLLEGLLAFYPFDGSGQDESGFGRHLTLFGDPTFVAGVHGQAVAWDGDAEHARSDASDFMDAEQVGTIAAWIHPVSVVGEQVITYYSTLNSNNSFWGAQYQDGSLYMSLKYQGTVTPQVHTAQVVPAGEWSHVAFVADGSSRVRMYLNGVELATSTISQGSSADGSEWAADAHEVSQHPHFLGVAALVRNQSPVGSAFMMGSLDDLRIYDRALSQSEIGALFQRGVS